MSPATKALLIRLVIALSLLVLLGESALAQANLPLQAITYRLSMPRPAAHLFVVSIEAEIPQPATTNSLDFQMPMWSPGRYAVFDFAKNVQEFEAHSVTCVPRSDAPSALNCQVSRVPVTRLDNQTWQVDTRGIQKVTVSYKVFGNDLSGTFSQLNTRHANFNGGSIFMYIVGHKPDPVKLIIDPPAGWRIVNGWTERSDMHEWQFPNWDVMIDAPTEIGPDWTEDWFDVGGKKYRVMVHSLGDEGGKRPVLVREIARIVRAETAMWGPPEFDSYTFMIHFAADDHSGDGMEHLTSTQIIQPGALADSGMLEDTLDTVAHEFFHVWNVKRLRPLELGPWDFTRPANTRGLWVAEGFTNYYGHLMQRRAGIWDDTKFLRRESTTIENIENAPGSRLMSAEDSSLSASFLDDAPHSQNTNLANTSISYYPKGELIAMVLDLIIRGNTSGQASLDDVMRRMYDELYLRSPNASYYLRGRGYGTEDVRRVASEVAGIDLTDFFKRYIRDVEVLPYDQALGYVGLRLVRVQAREPYNAGISIEWDSPENLVIANVRNDSAAEDAGLQKGDEIVTLAGKSVKLDTWLATLARFKAKDRVPIVVKRDRHTLQMQLILGAPERFEYRIEENPEATPEQRALRVSWLK
jgi:predicted metalloprotease with PDZ domain